MKESVRYANRLFQYKLDGLRTSIKNSNQVSNIIAIDLSQRPFHLNVIEAACHGKFKETGHSLVLADMLRHPEIQSSFLDNFLSISHEFMEVTAETDRVDVALKGKDMFVIVENKVNAAGEQENQVYRYVHEIGIKKYGYKMSQIYVVYLNPTNRSKPSDYSLCDENNENNVFDVLGDDHYTIQSYKYDITDWLRQLHLSNEPHISSALDQYIDFLENKFHTSQIDINMNNEIKEFLFKELQIEEKPLEEQMKALETQRKKANELLNAIDNIKTELSHKMIRVWQKQIEEHLDMTFQTDKQSFGVLLKNNIWLGIWDGNDSDNHFPYWGFQCDAYTKDASSELYDKIYEIIKCAGIEKYNQGKGWIAWNTTQNGVERFLSLYAKVKEYELLQ